jgi:hypothetical protein
MSNRIGVARFGLIGGKDLNVTLGFSLFQASVAAGSLAILLSSRFISPQKKRNIIYISFACVVNVLKVAFGAPSHFEENLSTDSTNEKVAVVNQRSTYKLIMRLPFGQLLRPLDN